jgi:hypothetical protein
MVELLCTGEKRPELAYGTWPGGGAAEPQYILWLDENSSLRMDQNALNETRLTLERGFVLIEMVQEVEVNRIRVQVAESFADIEKEGVCGFDASLPTLRVYKGRAVVERGMSKAIITGGKMVNLHRDLAPGKFDGKIADGLHEWAGQRSLELFLGNEETRKRRNWRCWGGGWLWNQGFQLKIRSELYKYILEEDSVHRVNQNAGFWMPPPTIYP